ncbi:MAG: hypothetical protein ACOCWR_11020 [Oceanidesulfovibrio sp.]
MKLNGPPVNITGYTREQMWTDILEWSRFSDSIASREMRVLATKALDRIRAGLPEMPPSAMSGLEGFAQTYLPDTSLPSIIKEQA